MSRLQNGIGIWSPIFVIIPSCKTAKTCFLIVYCPVNSIKLFGNDYRTDIIFELWKVRFSTCQGSIWNHRKITKWIISSVSVLIEVLSLLPQNMLPAGTPSAGQFTKYQWIISKMSSKVAKCSLDRAIGALTNFASRFWEDWVLQRFLCFDIDNWS